MKELENFQDNDSFIFLGVIKQIAELKVGILTQCIKTKTLTKTERDRYTVANILQKVNAKLNGKNHVIDVSSFDNG